MVETKKRPRRRFLNLCVHFLSHTLHKYSTYALISIRVVVRMHLEQAAGNLELDQMNGSQTASSAGYIAAFKTLLLYGES